MDLPEIRYNADRYPLDNDLEAARVFWESPPQNVTFDHAAQWVNEALFECGQHTCAAHEVEASKDDYGKPIQRVFFSTSGWSGAEDLLNLIESNPRLSHSMKSWRRGGHYVFEFPA